MGSFQEGLYHIIAKVLRNQKFLIAKYGYLNSTNKNIYLIGLDHTGNEDSCFIQNVFSTINFKINDIINNNIRSIAISYYGRIIKSANI